MPVLLWGETMYLRRIYTRVVAWLQEDQREIAQLKRTVRLLERDKKELNEQLRHCRREMEEIERYAEVFERTNLQLRPEIRRSKRGLTRRPPKRH